MSAVNIMSNEGSQLLDSCCQIDEKQTAPGTASYIHSIEQLTLD